MNTYTKAHQCHQHQIHPQLMVSNDYAAAADDDRDGEGGGSVSGGDGGTKVQAENSKYMRTTTIPSKCNNRNKNK